MRWVAPYRSYFVPAHQGFPRIAGYLIRQGAGWWLIYSQQTNETYLVRAVPGGYQVDVYKGYATPPCCG